MLPSDPFTRTEHEKNVEHSHMITHPNERLVVAEGGGRSGFQFRKSEDSQQPTTRKSADSKREVFFLLRVDDLEKKQDLDKHEQDW